MIISFYLKVVGALVTLGGTVEFINNTVLDGAAILLHLYSQMSLADNLQLLFDGNLGRCLQYLCQILNIISN